MTFMVALCHGRESAMRVEYHPAVEDLPWPRPSAGGFRFDAPACCPTSRLTKGLRTCDSTFPRVRCGQDVSCRPEAASGCCRPAPSRPAAAGRPQPEWDRQAADLRLLASCGRAGQPAAMPYDSLGSAAASRLQALRIERGIADLCASGARATSRAPWVTRARQSGLRQPKRQSPRPPRRPIH